MAGDVLRKTIIETEYRVDASQLNSAESAVRGLAAPIQGLENSIKDLITKINSFGSSISSTVGASSAEFSALSSTVSGIGNDTRKISTNMAQGFNNVVTTVDGTTKEVQKLGTTAEKISTKMEAGFKGVETAVRDNGKELQKLNTTAAKIGTTMERGFDRMENSISEVSVEIWQLKDRIEESNRIAKEGFNKVVQALQQTKKEANNTESAFDKLSGTLGAVKAAAAGFISFEAMKGLVTSASDWTAAMNHFRAATGASFKDMEQYGESAKAVFNEGIGETPLEIAQNMAKIGQNTKATGKNLEQLTKSAMALQKTFDWDPNELTRTTDMAYKQWGYSHTQTMGLLAKGAQMGLDKNQNLLDSMNEYAVHFKKIGMSGEDMIKVFAAVGKQGVFDFDKAGDALKEFSIRAIDGSDSTVGAYVQLGLNADTMAKQMAKGGPTAKRTFATILESIKSVKDPVQQDAIGVALFGTMWEDMGKKAIFALGDTKGSLGDVKGTLSEIERLQYNDATTAFKALGRTINTELAGVAGSAVNHLRDSINKLRESGKLKEILEGFTEKATEAYQIAKNLGSALMDGYNTIKDNWSTIGPIIAGVTAALVAYNAVVAAYNAGQKLQAAYNAIVTGSLKTQTVAIWANNVAMLANPWTWIVIGIVALIAAIVLLIVYWDEIKATILEWWAVISPPLQAFWDKCVQVFQGIWEVISPVVMAIVSFCQAYFQIWWMVVSTVLQGIWSILVAVWTAAYSFISTIVGAIVQFAVAYFQLWWAVVSAVMEIIWTVISGVWQRISAFLGPILSAIWAKITSTWQRIWAFIGPIVTNIWTTIQNAFNNGVAWLTGLVSTMAQIGRDIISGLINGITEKIGALTEKITSVKNTIVGGLKNALQVHSPSKLTMKLGTFITEGLSIGMQQELPTLNKTTQQVATAAIPAYSPENTVSSTNNATSENNSWAPVFNLTINGADNPRVLEQQVRQYVADAMRESFQGFGRAYPRLREV